MVLFASECARSTLHSPSLPLTNELRAQENCLEEMKGWGVRAGSYAIFGTKAGGGEAICLFYRVALPIITLKHALLGLLAAVPVPFARNSFRGHVCSSSRL
jgi:hypothetical protein